MRRVLTDLTASLQRSSSGVALLLSATNAGLAFFAFHEWFSTGSDLNGATTTGLAGMVAFACWGALHAVYRGVMGGVPAVDPFWRRKLSPELLVAGAFILCMSTYANITVTAGADAIEIHEAQQIDSMLSVTSQLQTTALSVGQISPTLVNDAAELKRKAGCEAKSGCLSGTPGAGALTDALNSAAAKVESAAQALIQASAAIVTLTPQLEEAFARKDDVAIRTLFAHVRASIPLDMLSALAADLRSDFGIAPDGRNAAVRARQADAIARLQKDLAALADGLDQASERLRADLGSVALPERETITKSKAIWLYADQLVPQLSLGIALDLVPFIIAFFIAKLRDATPPEDDDVSDISLAQARRNHRELSRLLRELREDNEPMSTEADDDPEPPLDPEPEEAPNPGTPPWDDQCPLFIRSAEAHVD